MTGEELKKKLKGERYSITDLADKLGMTRPNLSQALSVKDVKTGLVEDLARVLNLPVSFFFGEDTNCNNATANGDSSVAAINSSVIMENSEVLKERITHLEEMLAEKERTIQILIKNNNNKTIRTK